MSIKSLFEDIADAIREKSGSIDTYTPAEMPDAITNLPSGGGVTIADSLLVLNATANDYTDPFGFRYIFSYLTIIGSGSNRQPYNAFNTDYQKWGNDVSYHPSSGTPQWLKIQMPAPVKVKRFRLGNRKGNGSSYKPTNFTLQGSNDDNTWTDLGTYTWNDSSEIIDCTVVNPQSFLYYRIYENAVSSSYGVIAQWRFLEVE